MLFWDDVASKPGDKINTSPIHYAIHRDDVQTITTLFSTFYSCDVVNVPLEGIINTFKLNDIGRRAVLLSGVTLALNTG